MSARRYSPEDRAKALALAEAVGPTQAARRLGIQVATVTAWRSKARRDPDAFAVDIELGDDLLAEADGGYSLAELEAMQRRVGRRLDDALDAKRTLDSQRLGVLFGIVSDKVGKARQSEQERTRGLSRSAEETMAELRKHAEFCATVRIKAIRAMPPAELRAEAAALTQIIRRLAAQRRVLIQEQLRRRIGAGSLFAHTIPAPFTAADVDWWSIRGSAAIAADAVNGAPSPGTEPRFRPQSRSVDGEPVARDVEHEYVSMFVDASTQVKPAPEPSADDLERVRRRASISRSRSHFRVQGGRVLRHPHQGLRTQDLSPDNGPDAA